MRSYLPLLLCLVIFIAWMATLVLPGKQSQGAFRRRVLAISTPFLLVTLLVCFSAYLRFNDNPATGSNSIRTVLKVLVFSLSSVFIIVSLMLLIGLGIRVFKTFRVLGRKTPGLARRTLQLRVRVHKRSNSFFWITIIIANIIIFKAAQTSVFLCLLTFQLAATIHIIGNKMVPPSVLFLSSSRADTLGTQDEIQKCVSPIVVTSLIDPDSSTAQSIGHLEFHSFRSPSDVDWIEIVQSLAQVVPLVVLDVQDMTMNIEAELSLLLSQGLAYKTILLLQDGVDKKSAAASFVNANMPIPRMEYKEELLGALRSMIKLPGKFPSPP